MPNELRGELELDLGGRVYVLRATWDAVRNMETLTKRPWGQTFKAAVNGELGADEMISVLYACARAGEQDLADFPKYNQFAEAVYKRGLLTCMTAASRVLTLSAFGGEPVPEGPVDVGKDEATTGLIGGA